VSDKGRIARFFDAIASRYDRVYALDSSTSRARMSRILRELPSKSRVLDLGVGTGRELSALQDAGHTPIGLDSSVAMLAICARRTRAVTLVRADFYDPLPFDAESFDAVLALHGTLAHPSDDHAHARLAVEIARVLRHGGTFIAEVPTRAWADYEAHAHTHEDPRVKITGPKTLVHTDDATGMAIDAQLLDAEEWRAIFTPRFEMRDEALSPYELLLIGRRN
jgi:SAM-dependent methyltransferase